MDQNHTYPIKITIFFFYRLEPISNYQYEGQGNKRPTYSLTNLIMIQKSSKLKDKLLNAEKLDHKKGGI